MSTGDVLLRNGLRLAHLLPGLDPIRHVTWSPSGKLLAVALGRRGAAVWDVAGERLCTQALPQPDPVLHVSWSPDGEALATAGDFSLRVWRPPTDGRLAGAWGTGALRLGAVSWSADSLYLGAGLVRQEGKREAFTLQRWAVATGACVQSVEHDRWRRCHIGTSADRRLVALALQGGTVEIWDVAACRQLGAVPAGYRELTAVALESDGKRLVLAAAGGTVEVWDLSAGEKVRELAESPRTVYSLAFSPCGEVLAAKARDGEVRFWETVSWTRTSRLEEPSYGHLDTEIAFNPTGTALATYARMSTALQIWNLDMDLLKRPAPPQTRILFFAADPFADGPRLRLDEELREIREKLQLSLGREHFELRAELAARPEDLVRALHQQRPHLVQFSGHGSRDGAIIVEDRHGGAHRLEPRALEELFALVAQDVSCVVLNSCYGEAQAQGIARSIHYVVGTRSAVPDSAAIAFSVGFYLALGEGRSIEEAFRFGGVQMCLEEPGAPKPEIWKDGALLSPSSTGLEGDSPPQARIS